MGMFDTVPTLVEAVPARVASARRTELAKVAYAVLTCVPNVEALNSVDDAESLAMLGAEPPTAER